MIRNVNGGQAHTMEEFVDAISKTAFLPRSKRGGLNGITVFGEASDISSEEPRYRFIASFMKHCRGEDNQIRAPCGYCVVGIYEKDFDERQIVDNNLGLIQQRLNDYVQRQNPECKLKSHIEGNRLIVDSAFAAFDKAA